MAYEIRKRVKVITENTTITDTDFGGWMCVNVGTGTVEVDKVPLEQYQGLDFTAAVQPGDYWKSPIQIIVNTNGKLILSQLICKVDKLEKAKEEKSVYSLLKTALKK